MVWKLRDAGHLPYQLPDGLSVLSPAHTIVFPLHQLLDITSSSALSDNNPTYLETAKSLAILKHVKRPIFLRHSSHKQCIF